MTGSSSRDFVEQEGAFIASRLAAIIDSSDDAIISKDLDGVIQSWNAGAERIFGYTAGEVVGRSITILFPPEHLYEEPEILARIKRGERVDHYEAVRVRKDGRRIHVSLTVSPIRDGQQRIVGASKIARDISDRVEAQVALRDAYVASQRAQRDAEDANRAKDEFLAMVSHELRTPLNAVAGWLQVLRAKRDEPALVERALDTADRNLRLLARIIDDLLDVTRIGAGEIALNREPFDVPPVLEMALNGLRPAATAKGLALQSIVSPWAGPVLGDPERFQQIVTNLVANSIKFTPSGGRVEVRAANDDTHVEVVVADTGQGIAASFLPHVFEAFRKGDRHESSRRHSGLGLGLAIVRHLVELHDGTVTAQSDGPGRGARLTVRLPLLKDLPPSP